MPSIATLHDSALIERTLAGQSECFGVLMNRHMPAVRRRVQSMAPRALDEDDLVQETFFKAWRYLPSFRSEASFRTWITRVATNEVLQRYRRDRANIVTPAATPMDAFASPQESQHEAFSRAETHRTVRRAVAALPEKYRRVAILCELDELTSKEAAGHLRSGVATVKTRRLRARQMLVKSILQRHAQRIPQVRATLSSPSW